MNRPAPSGLPPAQGLYDPRHEHDACGIGFVASIKGVRTHEIVRKGIEVLVNLTHRGACGCDPETGDGAGVLIQIPHKFFARECRRLNILLPEPGQYGVGMIFLPVERHDRLRCEGILERIAREEGLTVLGWRDTPVDGSVIGRVARVSQPYIQQIFFGAPSGMDEVALERRLYIVRKRAESEVAASDIDSKEFFYVPSLSARTVPVTRFCDGSPGTRLARIASGRTGRSRDFSPASGGRPAQRSGPSAVSRTSSSPSRPVISPRMKLVSPMNSATIDDVCSGDGPPAKRPPARGHRVEHPARLLRGAGADLDDVVGKKILDQPGQNFRQQGRLGPSRVVLRQLGDALEEQRPGPVVKVLRGQGLRARRQPSPDVLLEAQLLGPLVRVHVDQIAHGTLLLQARRHSGTMQAIVNTTWGEGSQWSRP